MTLDIDAIRARDASDYAEAAQTQAMADRRDLLAEVDRLTAELDAALEVEEGLGDIIKHEDALSQRAEAVIEAARALVRSWDLGTAPFSGAAMYDALRAALAEYDR